MGAVNCGFQAGRSCGMMAAGSKRRARNWERGMWKREDGGRWTVGGEDRRSKTAKLKLEGARKGGKGSAGGRRAPVAGPGQRSIEDVRHVLPRLPRCRQPINALLHTRIGTAHPQRGQLGRLDQLGDDSRRFSTRQAPRQERSDQPETKQEGQSSPMCFHNSSRSGSLRASSLRVLV